MLGFNEYQENCTEYSVYDEGMRPFLLTMGLCGEAGEVAEKMKKHYRDGGNYSETRYAVGRELGDVLWYAGQLARFWNLTLEDVARGNLLKLEARRTAGTIHGSGDSR